MPINHGTKWVGILKINIFVFKLRGVKWHNWALLLHVNDTAELHSAVSRTAQSFSQYVNRTAQIVHIQLFLRNWNHILKYFCIWIRTGSILKKQTEAKNLVGLSLLRVYMVEVGRPWLDLSPAARGGSKLKFMWLFG